MRRHAVAAAGFRSIERRIGALDEIVRNRDFGIDRRDAKTHRESDARARHQHRHFLDAAADAFGDDFGVGCGSAGQQDQEFLAAIPPERIALAELAGNRVDHATQALIAGAMSVAVVDVLEMIEIEK